MRTIILFIIIPFLSVGQTKQVLHYDETEGYNHGTRVASTAFFKSLESKLNIEVTQDSDGSEFTIANLTNYEVVIFSNTSGINLLNEDQKDALEWFIDTKGGGLIGIHAASDTYRHSSCPTGNKKGEWDWYAETMGGSVQNNPNHTNNSYLATISGNSGTSDITDVSLPWSKQEEYYYWEGGYLNSDIVEVLKVETTGNNSYDAARPVAWQRTNSAGSRIFYTSLGHFSENFSGPNFPRFRILMEDATAWALAVNNTLPVEFEAFSAFYEGSKQTTNLEWITALEVDADIFEVERSGNSKDWQVIGKVNAVGNSKEQQKYSFQDRNPLDYSSYYRLKQIDLNGAFEYSKTIHILKDRQLEFNLSPNPISHSSTLFFDKRIKKGLVRILNKRAQVLKTQAIVDELQTTIDLNDYPAGIYYLEVQGNMTIKVIKVIKI